MTGSFVATSPLTVKKHYQAAVANIAKVRKLLGRPLTLSEKIIYSHLQDLSGVEKLARGKSFVMLKPDRVAMQDATAQMAILQFLQSGKDSAAVPSTIHCDHLIRAHLGVTKDMEVANQENEEVFNFLKSAALKLGLGFWGPGAGIIHQVVFENYAFPGGLMIGTDSHTPNAGGLGMLAIGVGGADAVDVMAGFAWELLMPKLVAVKLTGSLKGWAAPKDVILRVLDMLTVKGGTNKIIEYIGPGTSSLSCTGKGTICNMGAELGATTSVFPFDSKMDQYLRLTERTELAKLAMEFKDILIADPEVEKDPKSFYDEVYEIDLDSLEPYIVGPHSPDLARPVSKLKAEVKEKNYPEKLSACLIGSCTNSSYEDIARAAHVAKQALGHGLKAKTDFFVSPGSRQIFATVERDGLLATLEEFGATILANACGPCIGQWRRDGLKDGDVNAIVTSFNRNFRGRNDANNETLGFISSPEMVVAYAISGELAFDPRRDEVKDKSNKGFKLEVPKGDELPTSGFKSDKSGYLEASGERNSYQIDVKPTSDRLELLKPFTKWDSQDFVDHLLLVKVKGKCTTDHISPAGKWLKYRGHLSNISKNMLLGAVNAFPHPAGYGLNQLTQKEEILSDIATAYKAQAKRWVIIADENYGEGSSREHAAMSPRFLGASTVIAKSFARIHETNLKKQGILALTFKNASDYDKIGEEDKVSVLGLTHLAPGKELKIRISPKSGSSYEIPATHSYNEEQINWFKAGSSLNMFRV